MTKSFIILLAMALLFTGCTPYEVINYRTYTDPERGMFYIVDGVLDKGVLISGVGTDQTRVTITRQGN